MAGCHDYIRGGRARSVNYVCNICMQILYVNIYARVINTYVLYGTGGRVRAGLAAARLRAPAQGCTGRHREAQRGTERHREAQRGTGRHREAQREHPRG